MKRCAQGQIVAEKPASGASRIYMWKLAGSEQNGGVTKAPPFDRAVFNGTRMNLARASGCVQDRQHEPLEMGSWEATSSIERVVT